LSETTTETRERLRDLLVEAIRYGDRPDIRARVFQVVDNLADREHCRQLLEERASAHDSMDAAKVRLICEDMERAEAPRLQPHFIASFFHSGSSVPERAEAVRDYPCSRTDSKP
jgi:hypothetical protein